MIYTKRAISVLAAAMLISSASAFAALPVNGRWLTEDGKALVQIGPCGKAVCGQILKVVKPTPRAPRNDANNPDATLRDRPIEGLRILTEFVDGGSHWKGKIYDPQSGKTYTSKLSRNPNGTLKVQGCIAFFCKTQTWTGSK